MVTPRNVLKATCMMEDAHVASWPDGRLAGPVAQIHLFASIYQENELFIRILARSDADSGGRRSERQKRFVNGEFIDGVMSMHRAPRRLPSAFSRLQSAREIIFYSMSQCVRPLILLSLQHEDLLLHIIFMLLDIHLN